MAAIAQRTDPYVGSHFFIEVEGIDHGGFSECTGLDVQTEVLEYAEGGNNGFVHKLPGRTKFANIVLKHGVTDSTALWEWYQNVLRGKIERKDVSVVLYSNSQEEARRWNVREAFPVKWTGPAFNAGSAQAAIETLELAHHGFEVE